jgi:hypothetical protein
MYNLPNVTNEHSEWAEQTTQARSRRLLDKQIRLETTLALHEGELPVGSALKSWHDDDR